MHPLRINADNNNKIGKKYGSRVRQSRLRLMTDT
jgi:hypothetical protein